MLRIRGTVGALPVDLNVEMDPQDWAQLGAHLGTQLNGSVTEAAQAEATAVKSKTQDDALWRNALALLEGAGQLSGPAYLEQLEGLAGSVAAAKRLLVRLRHSPLVNVQSGADAPLYCWVG
jgi:hypothetical protein